MTTWLTVPFLWLCLGADEPELEAEPVVVPLPACPGRIGTEDPVTAVSARSDGQLEVETFQVSGGSNGAFVRNLLLVNPKNCTTVGLSAASVRGSVFGQVHVVSSGRAGASGEELRGLLTRLKASLAKTGDPRDDWALGVKGWRPGAVVPQRSSVAPVATLAESNDGSRCGPGWEGTCQCPCYGWVRAGETLHQTDRLVVEGFTVTTWVDEARLLYRACGVSVEQPASKRSLWLPQHDGCVRVLGLARGALWFAKPRYMEPGAELLRAPLKTGLSAKVALSCADEDPRDLERVDAEGVWVRSESEEKPVLVRWSELPARCP